MNIAYTNGDIFTGHQIESKKAVLVTNAIVEAIVNESDIPSSYERHDLKGNLLAPAFIDLQLYGGNGHMFLNDSMDAALDSTYQYCKQGGAGYFMMAMATNTMEQFVKGIEAVKRYKGKGLLGLHLEGPYLNPKKRGAHIEKYIKSPTLDELKFLFDAGEGIIQMMTIAPECCSDEAVDFLVSRGIILSAGHTNATYAEAKKAFEKIPMATHLYNAMSGLQHRAPGVVGAIFDHASVKSSVVCDGIHADFAAVRIAKQIMKERLFYITDAVTEITTGEYQHLFKEDHYALPDGTLSGSSLTMLQCVKNGVEQLGITLEESLRMASSYPGSMVNTTRIGVIEAKAAASFCIIDKQLTLLEFIEA
ncbi:MAG: N-acetylglucosamine-6-phosphate deacetylase [Chitinophagaceae bacterium]|nr:N-acetylglucosamine-6-phosphate deacetylase [Chitinophagaceae bacterium]